MTPVCNLIIDSCCDLPRNLIEREGVFLIQFPYLFGEEQHLDDMYASFPPHDFYERIRKGGQPSTAQVPMSSLIQTFTAAAERGVPTVYLAFTSGLSGSYNTSLMIADQIREQYPDFEFYVVDSGLASIAEGFIVYEALRLRDNGMSAKDLAAWAEEAKYYVNCEFMVEDLDSLARGGRLPAAGAYLGSKLDVKPLVNFDLEGHLSMKGIARGRKKAIKHMADTCLEGMSQEGVKTIFLGNADCPKDQRKLMELIDKGCQDAVFVECNIGPTIGSHVGPGMLAVVFWGDDRRESISISDRIARRVKEK